MIIGPTIPMTMGMIIRLAMATRMADPSITTSDRGLWEWSFVGLAATAMLQLFVVFISGSVALLADTIHNFGDAATAIPLAVAFWFARKTPSERFTFGYGRVEDLAGVAIVLTILVSAIIAGYESIEWLLHPQDISYLWAVMAALSAFSVTRLSGSSGFVSAARSIVPR